MMEATKEACYCAIFCSWRDGSVVKTLPANAGDRFSPWVGKIPWRRKGQPTPVFLPGESPWIEEPVRLQSLGSQSWTRLSMHIPLFLKAIKTSYMKPTWWDISLVYFFFFLPILIFFSCLHFSLEDELLTNHIFNEFSSIFSNSCLNIHSGNYMNIFSSFLKYIWTTQKFFKKSLSHNKLEPQDRSLTQEKIILISFLWDLYVDYYLPISFFLCLICFQWVFEVSSPGKRW